MSISITGGVHLGGNDAAPYISLHAQIGTLPTINLDLGPVSSLSLTGGLTAAVLPPQLSGNILAPVSGVLGTVLAPVMGNTDPHAGGTTLHLGGTVLEVPIVVTNPILLN